MWNLLKSELLKLRRCQILLVGLVALALCPLVQYGLPDKYVRFLFGLAPPPFDLL